MPKGTARRRHGHAYEVDRVPSSLYYRSEQIREALDDLESVVYAIPIHGLVKIGYTGRLRHRLSCYGLGLSDLLVTVAGGREEERALHARFATYLVRGREWFEQCPEILAWINAERDRLGVPPTRWPKQDYDIELLGAIAEVERAGY